MAQLILILRIESHDLRGRTLLLLIAEKSVTFVLNHLCEGNCEIPSEFCKAWKRFKVNSKTFYSIPLICRMGNHVWQSPLTMGNNLLVSAAGILGEKWI